jgi:16S rRNA (guanine527-N7)-methyltransferase
MSTSSTNTPSALNLHMALAEGLTELELSLNEQTQTRLLQYLDLLEKWNRVYNLTAIRDKDQMVSNHLLDSLVLTPFVCGLRILDVGSGAGLPGIPLALASPQLDVTLLDSNHKKAAFLRQAVAELALPNVSVVSERVESWQPEQKFDCIVSRAFAELAEFVSLAKHLLAPGGYFAAMKGLHPYEELEKLPPGWCAREVLVLKVPGLDAARHLVLIEAKQ